MNSLCSNAFLCSSNRIEVHAKWFGQWTYERLESSFSSNFLHPLLEISYHKLTPVVHTVKRIYTCLRKPIFVHRSFISVVFLYFFYRLWVVTPLLFLSVRCLSFVRRHLAICIWVVLCVTHGYDHCSLSYRFLVILSVLLQFATLVDTLFFTDGTPKIVADAWR